MKARDNEQLEYLYRDMYNWLFGYANVALSDSSRAEEAVQETFRIACDKLSVLLESENPRGWLVNTLKGVVRNLHRMYSREEQILVPLQDWEEWVDDKAHHHAPELLYQNLADTREFALVRAMADGMTIRELAASMGISENACKKRIQRSRSFLREKILK